ncbi:predicted protein, partial [Nematostella vectensis]
LFDSQNNNRGGHNVGGLYYYGGSILPIQWYGMHEDFDYYSQCKKRERNKGLFTIDQPLRGNTARFTRQDRQGTSNIAFLYPADDDSDSAIKGKWTFQASHGLPAPDCRENQWSRDNHQGNTYGGEFMTYNWTVPDIDEENCVLRIRYNISTGEYDGWDPDVNSKLNGRDKINIGAAYGLDRTNASKRGYLFRNDPD